MEPTETRGPFGLQIDGLEWRERLGRGGFSVVYRATQTRLDREVAVKVLTADLSDPIDVRRFETECRLMGRLGTHRHIVDVHDAGVGAGGQPYIVMKYYTGGTLASLVAEQGALPVPQVVDIGAKLADALATAHAAGVIHRDVKAENVLLDEFGEPVMADFGVAAVADPEGRYTSSIAFSRAYVAPEVLDRNEYGPASDIYSLGATLYTLLTGRPVFSATSEARTVLAVLDDAPPPIDRDDLPPALEDVVLACLAKDPADRPASAAALASALQQSAIASMVPTTSSATPVEEAGSETGTPSTAGSPGLAPTAAGDRAAPDEATRRAAPDHRGTGSDRSTPALASAQPLAASDLDDRTIRRPSRSLQVATAHETPPETPASEAAGRRRPRAGWMLMLGASAVVLVLVASLVVWKPWRHQLAGVVTTLAGSGEGYRNAQAAAAKFHTPVGVAWMGDGSLAVADMQNHAIRRVDSDGVVSTLSGEDERGVVRGYDQADQWQLPGAVAAVSSDVLVVSDLGSGQIRRVTSAGVTKTIAGSETGFLDGSASEARFNRPSGLAVGPDGTIYIADTGNNRIRRLTPDGTVTTMAGGKVGYQDGPGAAARFNAPTGIAVAPDGTLFVADFDNNRIRRIDDQGVVTTVAGGIGGYADGPGDSARFQGPFSVVLCDDGSLIVGDAGNYRLRRVESGGLVTTVAGSSDGLVDGPAPRARFATTGALAVRSDGSIAIADTANQRIRLLS